MSQKNLDDRTDEEIGRLLTDRWIYRGGILVLLIVFGILLTMLASRGITSLADQIIAGALIVCALLAAGVFVALRQQDRAMYRQLQDRRRRRGKT